MILNKFLILTLVLLPSSTNSCLGDHEPADFLVPPPAPPGQQSKKNHRSVPSFQFPSPPTVSPEIYNGQTDPPGLMQRVARWFGFGGGGYVNTLNNISPERTKDYQLQHTSVQPQIVQQQLQHYQPTQTQIPQQQNQLNQQSTQIQISNQQHHHQHQQNQQPHNQHQQNQQHHKLTQLHNQQQHAQQQTVQQHNSQQQQHQQLQQQLAQASYLQPQYKENPLNTGIGPYQYNRPKENCNPCNKIPWIPMWPGNVPLLPGHIHNRPQLPASLTNQLVTAGPASLASNNVVQTLSPHPQNIQQTLGQISVPSPAQQQFHHYDPRNENQLRAVRFNGPGGNLQLIPPPHLSIPPIPVPNLSAVPLPPLYNAQAFREPSNALPAESNNIPYIDHVEEPSELRPVLPTQLPPNNFRLQQQQQQHVGTNKGQFEIVKSVPVADYISSIEYPIRVTQSQVIDLTKDRSHLPNVLNVHKINSNINEETPKLIELGTVDTTNSVATEASFIHQISELPNNFVSQPTHQPFVQNQNFFSNRENQYNEQSQNFKDEDNYQSIGEQQEQSETLSNFVQPPEQFDFIGPITSLLPPTRTNPPNFLSSPIIVHNNPEPDNYPEASSHNITFKNENYLDSNNFIQGPTLLPEIESIFTTTTVQPIHEHSTNSLPTYDIIPSLETASEYPELFKDYLEKSKVPTESPVLYNHNDDIFPGKPFSKDNDDSNSVNFTPWVLQPTPTSTYSSVDASGKYAGMSPPSEFQPPLIKFNDAVAEKRPKQIHQLIVPYTTKIKPRPFKVREQQHLQQYQQQEKEQQYQQQYQQQQHRQQQQQQHQQEHDQQQQQKLQEYQKDKSDNRYSNWSNSHEYQEIHDQQESKLVTATQTTEEPSRKTTKYLTKILASNIRELLRREHAKRNKTNIDNDISDSSESNLKHLQKNIDDWTEQEYTSLKHKASTASIQKPSKIIPSEYLTTTTTTTQSIYDIENQNKIGATTQSPSTSTVPVTKPMKTSTMLNSKDDFLAHLEDNDVFNLATNNRNRLEVYTKSYMKNRTSVATTTTTTPKPSSTTLTSTSTTSFRILTSTKPFYHRNFRPTKPANDKELWQKLKVSISPVTNEKVYVVTPVPRFQTKATTPIDGIGTFKSPRFIVRPAPASTYVNSGSGSSSNSSATDSESSNSMKYSVNANTEKTLVKPYTPELFGLMGISAFVPDEPADISDGHSRVITVVTPTPHNKKRSIKYLELKRTTSTKVLPLFSGNRGNS